MPDGSQHGTLDDFLRSMLRTSDGVAEWADHAIQHARIRGATVKPSQAPKAQIRVFLGFHDPPDANYGQAIDAQRFDIQAPPALQFVGWFDRIFP